MLNIILTLEMLMYFFSFFFLSLLIILLKSLSRTVVKRMLSIVPIIRKSAPPFILPPISQKHFKYEFRTHKLVSISDLLTFDLGSVKSNFSFTKRKKTLHLMSGKEHLQQQSSKDRMMKRKLSTYTSTAYLAVYPLMT